MQEYNELITKLFYCYIMVYNKCFTWCYQTAQETKEERKNKSGDDGSYITAQVSHGDGQRKKKD